MRSLVCLLILFLSPASKAASWGSLFEDALINGLPPVSIELLPFERARIAYVAPCLKGTALSPGDYLPAYGPDGLASGRKIPRAKDFQKYFRNPETLLENPENYSIDDFLFLLGFFGFGSYGEEVLSESDDPAKNLRSPEAELIATVHAYVKSATIVQGHSDTVGYRVVHTYFPVILAKKAEELGNLRTVEVWDQFFTEVENAYPGDVRNLVVATGPILHFSDLKTALDFDDDVEDPTRERILLAVSQALTYGYHQQVRRVLAWKERRYQEQKKSLVGTAIGGAGALTAHGLFLYHGIPDPKIAVLFKVLALLATPFHLHMWAKYIWGEIPERKFRKRARQETRNSQERFSWQNCRHILMTLPQRSVNPPL